MRFTFLAPGISGPTFETLQSYSKKKLSKLSKFLPEDKTRNYEVRISVKKLKRTFATGIEIYNFKNAVFHCEDTDIRKCIDSGYEHLKRNLTEGKDKRLTLRRVRSRIKKVFKKSYITDEV